MLLYRENRGVGRGCYKQKAIGVNSLADWQQSLTGWAVARQGENLPTSCRGSKMGFFLWRVQGLSLSVGQLVVQLELLMFQPPDSIFHEVSFIKVHSTML